MDDVDAGGFKFFGVVGAGGGVYRRECRANCQGHACVLEHLRTHLGRRGERLLGLVGRGTWGSKVCETSSVGLRAAVWHYAPSWQVERPGCCS